MTTTPSAPVQGRGAQKLAGDETSSSLHILRQRPDIAAHCAHFAARVVQDALAEASAAYWLRRAEAFEAARPCHGDFHGQATREALHARYDLLTQQVAACRAAAHVFTEYGLGDDALGDVESVLAETRGAA